MTLSIRATLTLWYTALLCVLLVGFGFGVLVLQARLSRAQFDSELKGISSTVGGVLREELADSHDLRDAASSTRKTVDIPGRTFAIFNAEGRPLAARWHGFRVSTLPRFTGTTWLGTIENSGQLWRVNAVRVPSTDGDYAIVVAGSLDQLARERNLLARTLMVATPCALLLTAAVCWWAASRALRPVTLMAAQAEAITARSAGVQFTVRQVDDELGQLSRAFNRLLQRLASALQTQRQFMADASHELRTPISVARTAADVTLDRPTREESEYREALEVVGQQTDRLGRIVEDMLVLARADAGGYPVRSIDIYLDDIVIDCMRAAKLLADRRMVRLETAIHREMPAAGDDVLLHQLVTNLLDNAVKHTPPEGTVAISLSEDGSSALLVVSDTGPGIPEADRERVFERFVRLDRARDSGSGAGLGLPIARWIAEVHGGTLTLGESAAGGCRCIARLPILTDDAARDARPAPAA